MDNFYNNNEIDNDDSQKEWNWNLNDESEGEIADDNFFNDENLENKIVREENLGLFQNDTESSSQPVDESSSTADIEELADGDENEDFFSEDDEADEQYDNNSEEVENADQSISISRNKLALLVQLIQNTNENIARINELVAPLIKDNNLDKITIGQIADKREDLFSENENIGAKVIEGVYDGENMIGPDGKKYSMPVNYASKSKLVEGDIMKLTIMPNGTFVYKQIAPMDRTRVVCELRKSGDGFVAVSGDNQWRLLNASVTYYRGQEGDEVIIMIPAFGGSTWAAVDNIIKK